MQNCFETKALRKEQDVFKKHMRKMRQEIDSLKFSLTVTLKNGKDVIQQDCHFHYNVLSCVQATQSLCKS